MSYLEPDEFVVLEVRRHWLIFALRLFGLAVLAFLPLVVIIIAQTLTQFAPLWETVPVSTAYFFWSLWLIVIWVMTFSSWLHYWLDVWTVTNKRLVDFEFKGLFRYETSSMRLDRIQDITVEVNGLLANIFRFGDLHAQTAGEVSDTFIIKNAAHPEQVKKQIFAQHSQAMDKRLHTNL